ncbi:MAG: VOC family protein [Pseudomonadota bacterium]
MRKLLVVLLPLLSACDFLIVGDASRRANDAIVRGINYVAVTVNDLDQSTRLLAGAVNLETVNEGDIDEVPAPMALLGRDEFSTKTRLIKSSNAQLRFIQFKNLPAKRSDYPRVEVNGPGIAHVAFQVNKETKAYDRFLKAGGTPVNGTSEMTQLNAANPVTYAYARDANDTMYEFEHVDITQLDRVAPPKYNYRIRHVALATPDFNRAVNFYSILLQQEKPRRLGRFINLQGEGFDSVSGFSGAKLKMAFFQVRNMELEIAQYISHPTSLPDQPRPFDAPGFSMIVFDVEDLSLARKQLLAAGGTIVSESSQMDGGLVLLGRDLDGNLLGFQKISDESIFSSQNFDSDGST